MESKNMPAPQTHEQWQESTFYKAGSDARRRGQPLAKAVACLRLGCWQYDAFVDGYDAPLRRDEGDTSAPDPQAIKNPFRSKFMRENFEEAVQQYRLRHRNFFNTHGQPHRMNGFASSFWRGYFGEPMIGIPESTPAHAYYRAGQALGNETSRTRWTYDGIRSLLPGVPDYLAAKGRNEETQPHAQDAPAAHS
ncbi:hypothetical protein [Acidovorax sp.]|uniref:hypothetical protein n=1 Tax=Acidovorax sp. TaxID=1872122 RepID=UPI00391F009A